MTKGMTMKAKHMHIAYEAFAHALTGFSAGFEIVSLGEDTPMFAVVIPEGDTAGAKDIIVELVETKVPAFRRHAHGYGKTLVVAGSSLPPGAVTLMGTLGGWD